MILFDSSVIIDAREQDSPWHSWAREQIADAVAGEGAAINPLVLAEVCVRAAKPDEVMDNLEEFGFVLIPLPVTSAFPAAKAYAIYLKRRKESGHGEGPRTPLPDFFIGAHAECAGAKLVTRDPDRVRTYFPKAELVTP
jgi:predicted nucleic acid-binding protein